MLHHRNSPRDPRRAMLRHERGFTLVEVLVALVVVTVGLLGVAGASALALRASSAALRERATVARMRTRLALLSAAGCANATGGQLSLPVGLEDRWTVDPAVNGVRLVELRGEWDDVDRRRSVVLRSALLC